MKKLMFGAVALAAAVSFAEITSTNVVGYQNLETKNGNQAVGVTFVPVTGEGTMADIKIVGYSGDYDAGQISCGKLDTYGRSITRMFWLDLPEDPVEGWDAQYGWWDAMGENEYNDVPLTAGEGLWFDIGETWAKIQSAGQVQAETLTIKLTVGNQLIANATPVDLSMGDVFIAGYTGDYDAGQISCGLLDGYGRSIKRMFWLDLPEDPVEGWDAQYGWWDAMGENEYNADPLKSGESLWLDNGETGVTINFPSPLTK